MPAMSHMIDEPAFRVLTLNSNGAVWPLHPPASVTAVKCYGLTSFLAKSAMPLQVLEYCPVPIPTAVHLPVSYKLILLESFEEFEVMPMLISRSPHLRSLSIAIWNLN